MSFFPLRPHADGPASGSGTIPRLLALPICPHRLPSRIRSHHYMEGGLRRHRQANEVAVVGRRKGAVAARFVPAAAPASTRASISN